MKKLDIKDYPTCPFCGWEHIDWAEEPRFQQDCRDGTCAVIECGRCDRLFHATLCVVTEFLVETLPVVGCARPSEECQSTAYNKQRAK